MATHFNAFISYRHSPLDSAIAQRIHRQLERFKIPKAIQKLTGIKRIDRIFRDKEELPLSVNLSDDINEALINSDYLIVICSPRFQQSQWCMREIDLFLQTHPVERILIVLAEGEPDDVVPPILTQNREPLCCDYRMKPQKAKQIELPRLASALLGCRYDELRQRQRQYRMRRMVSLFSAALAASLALTAYFINTSIQIQKANEDLSAANRQIKQANVQIQNNLDQALLNQSQYLTSSSQERLEAGDRLTAIALALEALPGEDNDRPYVPEAEYALNEALGAYRAEKSTSAQGTFEAGSLVNDFAVTQDGKTLYIRDARGTITVWDTMTFQKQATFDLSSFNLNTMYLTASGNAVFTTNDYEKIALCYDQTGKELWRLGDIKDVSFADDGSTLLLLQHDYSDICRVLYLDPDTGKEVREPTNVKVEGKELIVLSFAMEEHRLEHGITLEYLGSGSMQHLYLADPATGSLRQVTEMDGSVAGGDYSIECVGMDSVGNIILMRSDSSGFYNGTFGNAEITSADREDLICYDKDTLEVRWQSEIISYIYSTSCTVKPIPETDKLLIQSGNTFQIHDSATGQLLGQCQTAANPLTLEVETDKTWGILTNGSYYSLDNEDFQCYATTFTSQIVDDAAICKGYFVHLPLSTSVTVYRSGKDESATVYDYEKSIYPRKRFQHGKYLVLNASSGVYMMDTDNHTMLWGEEVGYGYEALGFSQDGSLFYMWNRNEKQTEAFAVDTGERQLYPTDLLLEEAPLRLESYPILYRDEVLYLLEQEGAAYLRRQSLRTGETNLTVQIPALYTETMNYSENVVLLACAGDYLWLQKDGVTVYCLQISSGEAKEIFTETTARPFIQVSEDEKELLIATEHSLVLATAEGKILLDIDLGEQKGVSACFYGRQILVLCDNGQLHRYNRVGQLLSQTGLQIFNTFAGKAGSPLNSPMDVFWRFTPDGDLILNALDAGNIICCDSWQVKAFVPYISAYAPNNDEIITASNGILYAFRRCTVQEQMEKAREILGTFQLTEEQRKYYGLS